VISSHLASRLTPCQLYPFTLCTLYYGRGIAHAVLGDVKRAREQQSLFRSQTLLVPPDRVRHNNLCSELNRIAEAMLEGEILYREGTVCHCRESGGTDCVCVAVAGDYEGAFASLKEAVDLCDGLVYDEPWGWMQPPSHALGGLLLEQV
jgi:hypothetical protein